LKLDLDLFKDGTDITLLCLWSIRWTSPL